MNKKWKSVLKDPWLWFLIVAIVLAIIPVDPTDIIDAGTPIFEAVIGLISAINLLMGERK